MRKWQDDTRSRARIEIIPMIDVMMFLLVFFVLISINVIPALGVKTTLPVSSQTQEIKAVRNVIITLAKSGEVQLDGTLMSLDELPARLGAMRSTAETLNIIINGDEGVAMQRLIDVMDALKANGFDSFSIAAKARH